MTAPGQWLEDLYDPEHDEGHEDWRALTKAPEQGSVLAKRSDIRDIEMFIGERDFSLLFRQGRPYDFAAWRQIRRQLQKTTSTLRVSTDLWLKWVALHEQQNLSRALLATYWAEAAEAVERATGEHRAADTGRLTHDYLRRSAIAVMGATAAAQLIYVITGVVLIHPALAALVLLVAASFYWMSRLMSAEVNRAIRDRHRPALPVEKP